MKSTEFATMADAVRWVVSASLPEFADAVAGVSPRSRKKLDVRRQRVDSLFERLYFEFSAESDVCSFAMQLAVNYFPECPIPGGPFGYGALISDLIREPLRTELRPYWYGAGWYDVRKPLRRDHPFFELFHVVLRDCARPVLDESGAKLLADDLLRIAVGTHNELANGSDLSCAEETLSRRLDKIGPTSERGYPIQKIKAQLLARLRGVTFWHKI